MENYPQHPEWTEYYSAIDGIAKPKRNIRENDMGGYTYSPEEDSIRKDIVHLLELEPRAFERWYDERRQATQRLVDDYELFVSIPHLSYGSQEYTMDANTGMRGHVETLRKGLDYLDKIKQLYDEVHRSDTDDDFELADFSDEGDFGSI